MTSRRATDEEIALVVRAMDEGRGGFMRAGPGTWIAWAELPSGIPNWGGTLDEVFTAAADYIRNRTAGR